MKAFYVSWVCLLLVSACKSDKTETTTVKEVKGITIVEKIANSHGFENWQNVEKVQFTFKVDRDTIKGKGRSWTWLPKEDSIQMTAKETTTKYLRSKMDSTHVNVDRAFINDKFWLLVPFQLVWDSSAEVSEPIFTVSPISKLQLNMLTITYPNEGGYTPGDAYDIYYDNDFIIREWVFRKGNAKEPSLTTTFENYKDFNGIKIAIDHKQEGGNWNLNFADVSITLED